jgi:hypothetical protein
MRPITTAPRDETMILVYHKTHGWVSAYYAPSRQYEHHELGTQYEGAAWIIGDDILQEEVEEANGEYYDGQITHWMPYPETPK